ncbi:MAG: polyprenyl diphosphate synthase [Gammaproteobacteria bacterium]|nr:polyprenyl diphosphate synthase [Gammaproteobacteria bacterium]
MADQADKTSQQQDTMAARHVAIVMDGNGRWAQERKLPRHAGHQAGVKAVRRTVEACVALGIHTLTLFAFSSENWGRPREEIQKLMALFIESLNKQVPELNEQGVRLKIIGNREQLSAGLVRQIEESEALTAANDRLNLVIAVAYGGRWDIVNACKSLARQVAESKLSVEEIDENRLAAEIQLAGLGDPDLFIRTGGDSRISNFLLWNLAYTELHFSESLWPDFEPKELEAVVGSFHGRERRFGKTSAQMSGDHA